MFNAYNNAYLFIQPPNNTLTPQQIQQLAAQLTQPQLQSQQQQFPVIGTGLLLYSKPRKKAKFAKVNTPNQSEQSGSEDEYSTWN
ncbi:6705_t:CDS:2 [Dentiscutata heterogama]|uniref:6705_t:CDS:1 n=1 Tax=Dentiscutata heterogama TaxID=1316150 RepID=A0ACA9KUP9_9GLOM|nr:6705_t:CDS:2 [Dentiscutata heterogama]